MINTGDVSRLEPAFVALCEREGVHINTLYEKLVSAPGMFKFTPGEHEVLRACVEVAGGF